MKYLIHSIFCALQTFFCFSYQSRIYGSNITKYIKKLVNMADGYFAPLGIRIILSHIEVWADADKIDVSSNATEVSRRRICAAGHCTG